MPGAHPTGSCAGECQHRPSACGHAEMIEPALASAEPQIEPERAQRAQLHLIEVWMYRVDHDVSFERVDDAGNGDGKVATQDRRADALTVGGLGSTSRWAMRSSRTSAVPQTSAQCELSLCVSGIRRSAPGFEQVQERSSREQVELQEAEDFAHGPGHLVGELQVGEQEMHAHGWRHRSETEPPNARKVIHPRP